MNQEKQQRRQAHRERMQEAQASKLRREAAKLLAQEAPVFVPRSDSELPTFNFEVLRAEVQTARAKNTSEPQQLVVAQLVSDREAVQALNHFMFSVRALLVQDYDAAAYFVRCAQQLAGNSLLLPHTGWPATDKYMAKVRVSLESKGYPQGHRSL